MLFERSPSFRRCSSSESGESSAEAIKHPGSSDFNWTIRHLYPEENGRIDLEGMADVMARDLLTTTTELDEDDDRGTTTMREITKIEHFYKNVAEELSVSLYRWLDLSESIVTSLRQAEMKFRLIHRAATGATFAASTLEIAARAGLILFDQDFLPLAKAVSILGGVSLSGSIMALSYSTSSLEDVARWIRDRKRLHIDLETMYRKGKSADDSVQKLFPHGIDIELARGAINKTDGRGWRHALCSAIVLTNLREDRKILEDEGFSRTLRVFVRSNAAMLWINRIKMRELLDEMADKSKSIGKRELLSGSEAFLSLSAINLYPVFFSLFFSEESFEKVRLLSSAVTAILTAKKLVGGQKDEFRELRSTRQALVKEYKKIKKMNKELLSDYE